MNLEHGTDCLGYWSFIASRFERVPSIFIDNQLCFVTFWICWTIFPHQIIRFSKNNVRFWKSMRIPWLIVRPRDFFENCESFNKTVRFERSELDMFWQQLTLYYTKEYGLDSWLSCTHILVSWQLQHRQSVSLRLNINDRRKRNNKYARGLSPRNKWSCDQLLYWLKHKHSRNVDRVSKSFQTASSINQSSLVYNFYF